MYSNRKKFSNKAHLLVPSAKQIDFIETHYGWAREQILRFSKPVISKMIARKIKENRKR